MNTQIRKFYEADEGGFGGIDWYKEFKRVSKELSDLKATQSLTPTCAQGEAGLREVASKAWDAALKWDEGRVNRIREDCKVGNLHPDKETYLNSLSAPSHTVKEANVLYIKCPDCNGDGFTSEHDLHPHENGDCQGMCPVQVQCEKCHATGYIEHPANVQEPVNFTEWCLANYFRNHANQTWYRDLNTEYTTEQLYKLFSEHLPKETVVQDNKNS